MLKFYLIIVCLMFFFCGCNNRKDVFTYYKEGNKKYVYDYVKSGNNICIKQTEIENEITLFTFAVIEEDDELCDLILKNKTDFN